MSRDIRASSSAVGIAPPVVLAFQFLTVIDADGQSNTTMQAPVLPDIDVSVVGTLYREFTAQKLGLVNVAVGQIGAGRNGVPVAV